MLNLTCVEEPHGRLTLQNPGRRSTADRLSAAPAGDPAVAVAGESIFRLQLSVTVRPVARPPWNCAFPNRAMVVMSTPKEDLAHVAVMRGPRAQVVDLAELRRLDV